MFQIFIAEDEEIVRRGIEQSLNGYVGARQFSVSGTAEDGELALSQIRELRPDILITDIKMPFLSGLELARIVKEEFPDIRILIISGFDEFEFAKEAISIGVEEYLLKPVNARQLFSTLNKIADNIERQRNEEKKPSPAGQKENRDEFLGALTAGVLSVSQAYAAAKELDIDLNLRYFTAAELQLDYLPSHRHSLKERREFLKKLLETEQSFLFYMNGSDRAVLIVGSSAPGEGPAFLRERLDEMRTFAQKDHEVRLTAGIGSSCPRVSGIHTSFCEAHEALALLLGIGQGRSMTIGEIREHFAHGAENPRQLRDRIEYAVPEDAAELAQSWISQTGETCSYIYLYFRLTDFLRDLSDLIRKYAPEEPDWKEIFPESAMKDAAGNPRQLTAYIQKVITLTIEILEKARADKDEILLAKHYIRQHYHNPELSLNQVAEHVGISPNHLSMIFSTRAGQTFSDYLTQTRIQKAKELLSNGGRASDIAYLLGYNDIHYFRRQFKKTTGMTTTEYRDSLSRNL